MSLKWSISALIRYKNLSGGCYISDHDVLRFRQEHNAIGLRTKLRPCAVVYMLGLGAMCHCLHASLDPWVVDRIRSGRGSGLGCSSLNEWLCVGYGWERLWLGKSAEGGWEEIEGYKCIGNQWLKRDPFNCKEIRRPCKKWSKRFSLYRKMTSPFKMIGFVIIIIFIRPLYDKMHCCKIL